MSIAIAAATVVVMCGASSTAAYEQLNVRDVGCGDFITLCEYALVIVLDGWRVLARPREASWTVHAVVLAGFTGYSLLCNYALSVRFPVVVLLIMKNGNMVADVCLGKIVLGRTYSWAQIGSVLAVSCGIAVAAVATRPRDDVEEETANRVDAYSYVVGATCVVLALLLRAGSGVAQELIFQRTEGGTQKELLVWRSVLGAMILCAAKWDNVATHGRAWLTHEPMIDLRTMRATAVEDGASSPFVVSVLWIFMAVNMICDYSTKVAVGELIYRTSALSTSLVLVLMRFICIVISSCVVNAPPYPPLVMWFGCVLVFTGTAVYVRESKSAAVRETKKKKKEKRQ